MHWLATARYLDGQRGTAQLGATNLARDYDGFGRVKAIAAGVGGNPISSPEGAVAIHTTRSDGSTELSSR